MDNLKSIFQEYSDSAQSRLKKITTRDLSGGIIKLIRNKKKELLIQIDELEEGVLFLNLINETRNVFSGHYHKNGELGWSNAIKTFFRRSGFYCDIFYGECVDIALFYDNYCTAFQKTENIKYYFAPIELVSFAKSCMDFGEFQIIKFSMIGFEKLFPRRIYEIFYPSAIVNSQLCNYWYISSQTIVPSVMIGEKTFDIIEITDAEWDEIDEYSSQVHIEFSFIPILPLLSCIKRLALFNWQTDYDRKYLKNIKSERKSWKGFKIPFIIEYCDNLLVSPEEAPDIAIIEKLETEPYEDVYTGKDVGEGPSFYFNLDREETDTFDNFITHVCNMLDQLTIKKEGLLFIDTSINFMIKGFFTEGIEQILWHIISLEALLGEKGEGATERLSQRIASIFGNDKNQKEAIKKKFKKLHNHRCDLVHGRTFSKTVYIGHLSQAREFSRGTIIWFINYLYAIRNELSKIAEKEKRREILKVLDHDPSCVNLNNYLKLLPKGFPYVEKWLE